MWTFWEEQRKENFINDFRFGRIVLYLKENEKLELGLMREMEIGESFLEKPKCHYTS